MTDKLGGYSGPKVVTIDGRTKAIKISRQEAVDLVAGLTACLANTPLSGHSLGIPQIRFGNEFFLHIVPED